MALEATNLASAQTIQSPETSFSNTFTATYPSKHENQSSLTSCDPCSWVSSLYDIYAMVHNTLFGCFWKLGDSLPNDSQITEPLVDIQREMQQTIDPMHLESNQTRNDANANREAFLTLQAEHDALQIRHAQELAEARGRITELELEHSDRREKLNTLRSNYLQGLRDDEEGLKSLKAKGGQGNTIVDLMSREEIVMRRAQRHNKYLASLEQIVGLSEE